MTYKWARPSLVYDQAIHFFYESRTLFVQLLVRIRKLLIPTGATDAVSKGYLDGVQQGFDIKARPAVATGNGTLATGLCKRFTPDGVSATGDRIT